MGVVGSISYWIDKVRGEGITTTQIADVPLKNKVKWALQDFNKKLPKYVLSTITLVAGTKDYSLPTTALSIVRVYYVPSGSSYVSPIERSLSDVDTGPTSFHLPSQAIIFDGKYLSLLNDSLGRYEVLNTSPTKTLRLYPTPDSGTISLSSSMNYIYTATRSEAEIPAELESAFMDVLLYYCYRNLIGTNAGAATTFDDSGLTIKRGNPTKDYKDLAQNHKASFDATMQEYQMTLPVLRSDTLWY